MPSRARPSATRPARRRPGQGDRRQILVAVHQDGFAQRELLIGFCRHARDHYAWDLHFHPHLGWNPEAARAGLPWSFDGILLYSESEEISRTVRAYGPPCVDFAISWIQRYLPLYDEVAVGRLAGLHLREQGYPRAAFLGLSGWGERDPRGHGFAEGFATDYAALPRMLLSVEDMALASTRQRIQDWVRGLALPCAVFAASDGMAQAAAMAAVRLGLHMPDEIGLVGVDADPVLSWVSPVPLSSVRMPYQEKGALAARALDGLIETGVAPPRPDLLAPVEVAAQRSSVRQDRADPLVAAVRARIRERLAESPGVEAIAGDLALSRRTLERRFAALTGASLLDEIQRQRLAEARLRLRRGAGNQEAAAAVGLTANRFVTWFHRAQGCTPGVYRERWGHLAASE